mmetsp:Transcript_7804/g.7372  ORF Transcript_7804/g.7372 Transcript_7804/m.7372 type:complete len:86 (+) Transcript_7804:541-798(+)
MRCQTLHDTLQKEYHEKHKRKSRHRRNNPKRENPRNHQVEVTHDQVQDHLVVESEQSSQNQNCGKEFKEPKPIGKDSSSLNAGKI